MVIQRWQSLYLLIASIMMGFFCYVPMGYIDNEKVCVYHYPVYFTLNILIAMLLIISIFLFKNFNRQKTVVKSSMLLMFASAVSGVLILNSIDFAIDLSGAVLLLFAAFSIALSALGRIKADERLLKSYDRLR